MKKIYYLVAFIFSFCNASAQDQNSNVDSLRISESSPISKPISTCFTFGNLHGFAIGVDYRPIEYCAINGSIGVKSPINIIIGPPFEANRLNIVLGGKVYPLSWIYFDCGIYTGLFKLTEYLWISTPKSSLGVVFGKVGFEVGATFNMPTTIYTKSQLSKGETIGLGEERLTPSGTTFPFFKITYSVK